MNGGINNSPESLSNGFQYAYVVEFASPEDRQYYIYEEPAHQDLVKYVTPDVEKAQTLDFEPGVFRR